MKLKYLIMAFAGLGMLSACESDEPSNVIAEYKTPTTFVLNTPQFANGVYDLKNADAVNLTFSQPDYGYSAVCDYTVEVSSNETFTVDANNDKIAPAAISTVFHMCDIDIPANDFALAVCTSYGWQNEDDVAAAIASSADGTVPVYVRVNSKITNAEIEGSEITSNVIKLNVVPYFALPDLVMPTTMYMVGDFCGGDWNRAAAMTVDAGNANMFWCIRYVKAGGWFKFNMNQAWDGNQFGFNDANTYNSHVDGVTISGVDDEAGAMNIVLDKEGWYMFGVTVKIEGRSFIYTVDVYSPDLYVFGNSNGGAWEAKPEWKFTIPTTETGEFVSPALATDDEVRIALVTNPAWGGDWWAHELTLKGGATIYYRATDNIADSWEKDKGSDYSIKNASGKKVYLNFADGTGRVE